jgi:hypothetical protein
MALNPPKNVRDVVVRSCANCAHRVQFKQSGNVREFLEFRCERTELDVIPPWGDNIKIELTVCDGHKPLKLTNSR